VHVSLGDAVVGGSTVGGGVDVGDVEVSVIVLLEVGRDEVSLALELLGIDCKRIHKDIDDFVVTL